VRVTTLKAVKLLKKNRETGAPTPAMKVEKASTVEGVLNYQVPGGAGPRKWGEHLDAPFVGHKGKLYLHLGERDTVTRYLRDGVETPRAELDAWLPGKGKADQERDGEGFASRDLTWDDVTRVEVLDTGEVLEVR